MAVGQRTRVDSGAPADAAAGSSAFTPEQAGLLDELGQRASVEHDLSAVYAIAARTALSLGSVSVAVAAPDEEHLELGAIVQRPGWSRHDVTTDLHRALPQLPASVGHLLRTEAHQLRGSELRAVREAVRSLSELPEGHIAVAPLERRGRWYGGLVVVRTRREGRFGAGDLAFLAEIAQRAGVHLDTASTFAELAAAERLAQLRANQQAAVADLGVFALRHDLQAVLDRAVQVVAAGLQVPLASVMVADHDSGRLALRAGVGWPELGEEEWNIPLDCGSLASRALASTAPLVVDDLATDSRLTPSALLGSAGAESSIAVRIEGRDAPYGVLSAHSVVRHGFRPNDVEFVRTVAQVIASAAAQSTAPVGAPAPAPGPAGELAGRRAADPEWSSSARVARHDAFVTERLAFFEHAPDAFLLCSPDGRILDANPAACALLGYTREQLCALGRSGIADPADRRWTEALRQRRETGRSRQDLSLLCADATTVEAEATSLVFSLRGEERTAVVLRDIRDRVRRERELRKNLESHTRLALVDELTGLPNRRSFFTTVERLLPEATDAGRALHLLVADVDGLKATNDKLGHQMGDQLLADVAHVLETHFADATLVARLAGDEFVVVLDDYDEEEVAALLASLDAALGEHRARHDRQFPIEVSIGSAVYRPGESTTLDELLQRADTAMYASKQHRARPRTTD